MARLFDITARLVLFGASVGGSWLAGIFGAYLVWNFIYSIGGRVVTDEIHYRLYHAVPRWGAIAGVFVGLAVVISLRRPAPGVLVAGHAVATIAAFFGGSVGWLEGLWVYFGALAAFVICVASRALFGFVSHRNSQVSKDSLRIAVGGEQRLRKAVEAQVRQAHQDELSRASDESQRASIEERIQREIEQEMKRVASPYSLWSSR